jgi:hypothetical protein
MGETQASIEETWATDPLKAEVARLFSEGYCALYHDLLYMAGVLKWITIKNDYIRILAFTE